MSKNNKSLTDEEIEILRKSTSDIEFQFPRIDWREDDREEYARRRWGRQIEADKLIVATKLVEYSKPPVKFEESGLDLEEYCLQGICNHKDALGKSVINDNTCTLCNMKVYPITGEDIKFGLERNIFPDYVKLRILRAVNHLRVLGCTSEEDIDNKLKECYNNILDFYTYHVNLSGHITT